jgi:predicted phage-related endonuclease
VVETFWTRHVLGGEPPAVDGRPATSAALAARYADSEPELVADLGPYAATVQELRLLRAELADLDGEKDRLENEIKAALGPAEAGEIDGARVVTWRPSVTKRLDTTRLRDELPTLAAQYSTETTVRRFLLKELKR